MSYRNHNSVTDSQVLEEIKEKNMTLKFEDVTINLDPATDDVAKGVGSVTVIIHRVGDSIGFVLGPAAVETLAKALSTTSRWGK